MAALGGQRPLGFGHRLDQCFERVHRQLDHQVLDRRSNRRRRARRAPNERPNRRPRCQGQRLSRRARRGRAPGRSWLRRLQARSAHSIGSRSESPAIEYARSDPTWPVDCGPPDRGGHRRRVSGQPDRRGHRRGGSGQPDRGGHRRGVSGEPRGHGRAPGQRDGGVVIGLHAQGGASHPDSAPAACVRTAPRRSERRSLPRPAAAGRRLADPTNTVAWRAAGGSRRPTTDSSPRRPRSISPLGCQRGRPRTRQSRRRPGARPDKRQAGTGPVTATPKTRSIPTLLRLATPQPACPRIIALRYRRQ